MSLMAVVSSSGKEDAGFPTPDVVLIDEGGLRPAAFILSYTLQLKNGDFELLGDESLGPDAPVVVQVSPGGSAQTLIKGTVLRQSIGFVEGGDGSTLEVMGADLTEEMNRAHKNQVWTDVGDSSVVEQICTEYGLKPQTTPTDGVHSEATNSLVQCETDLRFIHRLARRNGYWFWLETDPAAKVNTAHFEKPPMQSKPSVVLSLRAGKSNVENATLAWDVDRPSAAEARQIDQASLSTNDGSVDRSPLAGLAAKALADVVKQPRLRQLSAPANDMADLKARAEAMLIEAGWFVTARLTAKLSVIKTVVRANTVVSLDGLGTRHSGNYLVSRVVHRIDSKDHVMTIDLIRNGWN